MSQAYSPTVRSLEKFPIGSMFRMAMRAQDVAGEVGLSQRA